MAFSIYSQLCEARKDASRKTLTHIDVYHMLTPGLQLDSNGETNVLIKGDEKYVYIYKNSDGQYKASESSVYQDDEENSAKLLPENYTKYIKFEKEILKHLLRERRKKTVASAEEYLKSLLDMDQKKREIHLLTGGWVISNKKAYFGIGFIVLITSILLFLLFYFVSSNKIKILATLGIVVSFIPVLHLFFCKYYLSDIFEFIECEDHDKCKWYKFGKKETSFDNLVTHEITDEEDLLRLRIV